ncbi:resolvase [Aurantimonas sp. Leaf443]|uniref:resolvase n=1 Tax=Aurantimonas sp. Leaf443 TaxID=1736378 RepID=UPI000AC66596
MTAPADGFTMRMFDAVNSMMLDMLAAIARKDYEERCRRVLEGQALARAEGRYKGRPEDARRNAGIATMLRAGASWTSVQAAFGCSRTTVAKVAARVKAGA